MLKTRERIITVDDLSQESHAALQNAKKEPLIVLEDGLPVAYLISIELFDSLMAHINGLEMEELANNLIVAEKQFSQGAFKSLDEASAIAESAWENAEQNG